MLNLLLRVGAAVELGEVDAEAVDATGTPEAAAVGGDGEMAGEMALRISVGDVGCGWGFHSRLSESDSVGERRSYGPTSGAPSFFLSVEAMELTGMKTHSWLKRMQLEQRESGFSGSNPEHRILRRRQYRHAIDVRWRAGMGRRSANEGPATATPSCIW